MENRFTPPKCSYCQDGWLDTGNPKGAKSGMPRRLCEHCGQIYHDNEYREPALSYYFLKPEPPIYKRWIAAAPITAFFIIYILCVFGITEENAPTLSILAVALIVFSIRMFRGLKDHFHPNEYEEAFQKQKLPYYRGEKKLSQEFSESLQRMSKEEYLYELISCGEVIPDYFFHRLGTAPDEARLSAAIALYKERQRKSALVHTRLELQGEIERYEEFLSLPAEGLSLRKQAEFHGMSPLDFKNYCQKQLEETREKLNELLSEDDT